MSQYLIVIHLDENKERIYMILGCIINSIWTLRMSFAFPSWAKPSHLILLLLFLTESSFPKSSHKINSTISFNEQNQSFENDLKLRLSRARVREEPTLYIFYASDMTFKRTNPIKGENYSTKNKEVWILNLQIKSKSLLHISI